MALQQLCGPWRARSRAALRPLGLLSPPARPLGPGLGLAARGAGGDADAGLDRGLDENRFRHKYRHRLRALRSADPELFESRLEKLNALKKQPVGYCKQVEFMKYMDEKAESSGTKTLKGGFTKHKTLDSVLNVEMVKDKTAEEIKQIWNQHFSSKDTIYAVIPSSCVMLITSCKQTVLSGVFLIFLMPDWRPWGLICRGTEHSPL